MGMGRVVVVQIAEASGLLCRAEASFQKSLGTKSNEDLTTRNEEYGLTKNNSCRPGAFAAWPKSFVRFRQWAAKRLARAASFSAVARQIKEITHAKRYGVQPDTSFRARN
jgi:hypothetical protein